MKKNSLHKLQVDCRAPKRDTCHVVQHVHFGRVQNDRVLIATMKKTILYKLQVDDRAPETVMCFVIQHIHFTSILVRGQMDRVLLQCKRDHEKELTA